MSASGLLDALSFFFGINIYDFAPFYVLYALLSDVSKSKMLFFTNFSCAL